MKIYLQGFNLIRNKFKYSILILILLTIIGVILEGFSIALLLPMMELLINPDKISNDRFFNFFNFFDYPIDDRIIYYFLLIFFFIFLLKNIFVILINYSQSKILLEINFYLSNLIFKKLLNDNFLNKIEKKSSSIIRTMISQTSIFSINFINSLAILISEILTFFVIIFLILILVNNEFFFILIGLIVILIIYFLILKKRIYNLAKITEKLEVERLKNFTNGIDSINEINIFNIKDYLIKNDFETNKKIIKTALTRSLIKIFPRSFIEMILILAFVIFAFYTYKLDYNFIDIVPYLAVITAALFKFIPTLTKSLLALQRIGESKPIIENICNNYFSSSNQNIYSSYEEKGFNHSFKDELTLKNISFSYPKSKETVFKDLNLKIKKNEKIAIFGDTGSGKSTLIKILIGIIQPDLGNIEVDNENIFKNIESWRNLISYVPQKLFLFDSSLSNNINLFDIQNNKKFKDIINKVFLSDENFLKLDQTTKNNQSKLSGGETKKVGIARALFKDHEILLVDEGTSGLDKEYSDYIISELLNLDKTVIFISHDYDQFKNFDHVYKIINSNIVKIKNE
ncbi:ATP-binding cassette domain-containing protein [Pelagibacterales bacterium SAG-MED45]|nr:ATP-binding cassette domain-containing protein [Pelagibacterales bacterium SAG-MED45]